MACLVQAPGQVHVFSEGAVRPPPLSPNARATSPVPSVEPSSTTIIPNGGAVWAWRLLIVSAMLAASLYAGTITVTSLLDAGRWRGSMATPGAREASRSRVHRRFSRPALEDKVRLCRLI